MSSSRGLNDRIVEAPSEGGVFFQIEMNDDEKKNRFYLGWSMPLPTRRSPAVYSAPPSNWALQAKPCRNTTGTALSTRSLAHFSRDVGKVVQALPVPDLESCPLPGPQLNPDDLPSVKEMYAYAVQTRSSCDRARILANLEDMGAPEFKQLGGKKELLLALADGKFLSEFNTEMRDFVRRYPKSKHLEQLRGLQLQMYRDRMAKAAASGTSALEMQNEYAVLHRRFASDFSKSRYLKDLPQPSRLAAEQKAANPILETISPVSSDAPELTYLKDLGWRPKVSLSNYIPFKPVASAATLDAILKGKLPVTSSFCECRVKYKDKPDAEPIGSVLTRSLGHGVESSTTACAELAKGTSSSSAPEWIALGSCKTEELKVSEEQRKNLKLAYEKLKEEAKERKLERKGYTWEKFARMIAGGLIGGIGWRHRGGGFHEWHSTQMARLVGALLPLTFIGAVEGGVDGAIMGALMIPALLIPWSDLQDQGRAEGSRTWDGMGMSLRGLAQVALPVAYANAHDLNGTPLIAAGLAMGACYNLSYRWLSNTVASKDFRYPTEYAEFCTGAALGAGLVDTLHDGKLSERKKAEPTLPIDQVIPPEPEPEPVQAPSKWWSPADSSMSSHWR